MAEKRDMKMTRSFKLSTKESQFDMLQEAGDEEGGPTPSETRNWSEHKDPDSGETYFYNAATGETSWEEPAEYRKQAGGAPAGGTDRARRLTKLVSSPKKGSSSGPGGKPAIELVNPLKAAGGAGGGADAGQQWKESTDPSSGYPYWYNEATGESTWDRVSVVDTRCAVQDIVAVVISSVCCAALSHYRGQRLPAY